METKKEKIKKYLDNLWYHEKAKIIIFGTLLVMVIIGITQCSAKKEADVYLLYAGEGTVTRTTVNTVTENMEKFIPEDYNKDGVRSCEFAQFMFSGSDGSNGQKAFDSEMYGGRTVILLLSPTEYKYAKKNRYIVTLQSAVGYTPEFAKDEYSVELFDLECASEMGVNMLPEDTVVCIAAPRTAGDNKGNSAEYKRQIKFFEYMLSYDMD